MSARRPSLTVDIAVEATAWGAEARLQALAEAAVSAAIAQADVAIQDGVEISIVFADDDTVRDLNRTWRGLDKPTNVLSFPAAEGSAVATASMLGDVILGLETVLREAEDEGKPRDHHVAHLLVHGVLHLLGYDHLDDKQADDMERREIRALAELGIPDPYADSEPVRRRHAEEE